MIFLAFPAVSLARTPLCYVRHAEAGCEMTFVNFVFATRPDHPVPFFRRYRRALSFVRVMPGNAEVRRVSSRHDDECRNVRLEARNSTVCSSVRARARTSRICTYTVYIHIYTRIRRMLYSGIARKHGVYEISRLRRSPGAFVAMLSRVRWIYSRSISRDFLPVNLRPLRRRDGSRHATRSPAFLPAWRRKFACVSGKRSTRWRWR